MPRLPSLGALASDAARTARRFPVTLLAAFAAALAATLTAEEIGPESLQLRLLAAASLLIPLSTALAVAGERPTWSRGGRLALHALGLLGAAAFYAAWPGWTEPMRELCFWQLFAAFAAANAVAPFLAQDRPVAFWQYNCALFLRALAAAASSGALFAGLALALAALDKLFGVDVPPEGYGRLWFTIAFVFNTWFYLAGVPDDLDALEREPRYPAPLRVFAQYILMPLVAVYLVILTVYFAKVVVTWTWPNGWIGWLVSGVATAGIFALLLVQPIAEQAEQKWIAAFARGFWFGMLPAILMLWLALWQRIREYGLTEKRYLLAALSIWLAAVAIQFLVTRSRRIQLIPASLCALALLTFAGPWGAAAVSARSQEGRLRGLLEKHHILVGGRIQRPATALSGEDADQINATVRYLVTTHGAARLRAVVGDSAAQRLGLRSAVGGDREVRAVVGLLGVTYGLDWAHGADERRFTFTGTGRGALPLAGYDYLVPLRLVADTAEARRDTALTAVVIRDSGSVRIQRGGAVLLEVPLDSLVARAGRALGQRRFGNIPARALQLEAAGGQVRALLLLRSVSGLDKRPHPAVQSVTGDALVTLLPGQGSMPPGARR